MLNKSLSFILVISLSLSTGLAGTLPADTNENTRLAAPADLDGFFTAADAFFQLHVQAGLVNYKGISKNPASLDKLVEMIATADLSASNVNTKIAFYINAYNILTIKNIVRQWPMKSPLDDKGFFNVTQFKIAGEMLTLNDLEAKKLRPDPRVHFVLVCGAKGCPTIMNSAYMQGKVQAQLDMQTQKALDNPNFIRVDAASKKVLISEIFNWYEKDFTSKSGTVKAYINANRTEPIPEGYSIGYYTYDWSVNSQ